MKELSREDLRKDLRLVLRVEGLRKSLKVTEPESLGESLRELERV